MGQPFAYFFCAHVPPSPPFIHLHHSSSSDPFNPLLFLLRLFSHSTHLTSPHCHSCCSHPFFSTCHLIVRTSTVIEISHLTAGPLFPARCSPPIQPTSRLQDKDPRQRTFSRLLPSSPINLFHPLYFRSIKSYRSSLAVRWVLGDDFIPETACFSVRQTLQCNGRLSHHTYTLGSPKAKCANLGLIGSFEPASNSLLHPFTFI